MGIQNFIRDLKKYFGYVPEFVRIEEMVGSKIAVDVSIWCYKAKYAANEHNQSPIIRYFINMILNFVSENIYPVFVFDGIPPNLKEITCEKRTKESNRKRGKIKEISEKIEEIQKESIPVLRPELISKYEKLCSDLKRYKKDLNLRPTAEEMKKLKGVFDLLGIPYITVNYHDAENFCSYLNKIKYVKWVLSSDSDCLISGANSIIYNYSSKTKVYSIHRKDHIMECLEFTDDTQLLNYSILVGTDYNNRSSGNGPKTSHKIIMNSKDFGTSETKNYYNHYWDIYNEFNYDYKKHDDYFLERYKFITLENKILYKFMNHCIDENTEKINILSDNTSIANIIILRNTLFELIK